MVNKGGFYLLQLFIKQLRKQRGLTIRELSEESAVSRSYISQLETGQKIPTIDTLCKLAKALKCRPEDLYKC